MYKFTHINSKNNLKIRKIPSRQVAVLCCPTVPGLQRGGGGVGLPRRWDFSAAVALDFQAVAYLETTSGFSAYNSLKVQRKPSVPRSISGWVLRSCVCRRIPGSI
ncbi:unnamed protein product [Cuscuta campestris]|uniref:Uncharacterized protein n=1 Tax=Cuscuta campestris TaxID=132261 RepID=A0A484LBU9_9ASTE|nr:unnamed protein product [Cuscuta campestris]